MVKPALGKGMKDLLPKTLKIGKKKKEDDDSLHEELKVTIERYRAQGFDVAPLKDLEDKPIDRIREGIDDYRNALKKLNSAMTVLKSLEGYGYTKEIKGIVENIKNPHMADSVFSDAEALKERAFAEHNIHHEKVDDTPGARVMKSLQARSKVINGVVGREDKPLDADIMEEEKPDDGIKNEDLDDLLNSMDGLGEGLDLNFDDLVEAPPEEEHPPEPEEPPRVEEPTAEAESVPESEPDEPLPVEEQVPPESVPEPEEEPVPETSVEPEEKEVTEQEPEGESAAEESPPAEEPVNVELLMEKAKDLYRSGDMVESLSVFEDVLKNDPDNSKAKFMIRRIKQKLE
ncbi:MAG: hypothetical protein ACMUIG_06815 [Thermoplasmatota archaeon]